jgi:hypothetical protein
MLEQAIDNQIVNLIKLIETKYLSTGSTVRPMDFVHKAQFLTLDLITMIGFGGAFGYLVRDEDDHEYIKTTEETIPYTIMVGVLPWLTYVLQSPLLKMLLPSEKDTLGIGKVMGYVF